MFHKRQLKILFPRTRFVAGVVMVLFSLGMLTGVFAQDGPQVEPSAGTWDTWILESGSQFRLDAPPDEAATTAEIAELVEMAGQRDDAALKQIAYWNSGPASYRWNQIAVDAAVKRGLPANLAYRGLALMHVAIYDATVAAWDSKYTYNRPRPSEVDASLETVIPNPASPAYPSEYAATAGAASAVLAWWFPDEAQMFMDKAQEATNSRLLAGVEYPSDVEAGLELGKKVAELVIAYGEADGSTAEWTGSIPTEPGHWTGENPVFPNNGSWKPWVLTSGDQFRPGPPPAYDSEQMAAEMEEVRSFERTPVTNSIAQFWEFASGGRRTHWLWNDIASRSMLEYRWDDNAPRSARAYALLNIAGYDSIVACWDAKYTYWAMRPFQIDPEFKPLFTTPNHPSYPSAHSCISTAVAKVLADLFPVDADNVMALAHEATESRIWAGIHFRSDVTAGVKLGEDVAGVILDHAHSDGSQ